MNRRTPASLISQFLRIIFSRKRSAARIAALLVSIAIYIWQTYPLTKGVLITQDAVAQESEQVYEAKKVSTPVYVSPAGVRYGADPSARFDSRIDHIMAHTQEDASKRKHSVFLVKTRQDVLALIDEAWQKRGPPHKQGKKYVRDIYDIDMGREIGSEGEHTLRLITEADSSDIVTAYPYGAK